MKKLQFLSYLFAALFTITMVSCSDDDDGDNNVTPDQDGLLVGKTWRGDKVYLNGIDITESNPAGVDVTTINVMFNADGTFTGNLDDDGDDDNDDTDTGRWSLSNDGTKLTLTDDDDDDDDEIIVDVNRLTSNELWLEGDFTGLGQPIEIRFVN